MDRPKELLGLDGTELEVQYDIRLSAQMGGAQLATLRKHIVMVAWDDDLYEFIYSADVRDYDQYHESFDHLLESIRFTQ